MTQCLCFSLLPLKVFGSFLNSMHSQFSLHFGSIPTDIKLNTSAALGKQGPLTSILVHLRTFLIAQLGKILPAKLQTSVQFLRRQALLRRDKLPTLTFFGLHGGSAGKESAFIVGCLGLIPGLGRSPGVRKGYPLQYSGQENSMVCILNGVNNHQTRLSNFHFHLFRPSNLFPSRNSKYFSQSYNRALKCDSVKW